MLQRDKAELIFDKTLAEQLRSSSALHNYWGPCNTYWGPISSDCSWDLFAKLVSKENLLSFLGKTPNGKDSESNSWWLSPFWIEYLQDLQKCNLNHSLNEYQTRLMLQERLLEFWKLSFFVENPCSFEFEESLSPVLIFQTILGIAVFLAAGKFSSSMVFRLGTGSAGFMALSVLILLLFVSRYFPHILTVRIDS